MSDTNGLSHVVPSTGGMRDEFLRLEMAVNARCAKMDALVARLGETLERAVVNLKDVLTEALRMTWAYVDQQVRKVSEEPSVSDTDADTSESESVHEEGAEDELRCAISDLRRVDMSFGAQSPISGDALNSDAKCPFHDVVIRVCIHEPLCADFDFTGIVLE